MSVLRASKYVNTLPGVLEASTIYFVRSGGGFDIYVTNEIGLVVAYPLNQAAGAVSSVVAQVDFGASGDFVEVNVAAPWASATLRYICTPALPTTTDHNGEDALLEELTASVIAVNPGVGFTLGVYAPNGTWGRYDFSIMGVS